MVDIGGTVGPLVGTREWRHAHSRIKRKCVPRFTLIERLVQIDELRRDKSPVIQCLLHFVGDSRCVMRSA